MVRDVGIREEICLIDANIGLVPPVINTERQRNNAAWYMKIAPNPCPIQSSI